MKRTTIVAGLLLALVAADAASAQDTEEEAIRQAIGHYFEGHATGQGSAFEKVFHPDAKLFWFRDGQLNERTSAEYIAGAPGHPAEDEARRKRRIASIDVTGNAAVVKIELDYPGAFITDYMSMLKIDGEWKIVNKIFYVDNEHE